jgi:dTDP-4-dehydrorhamnose reductase
MPNPVNLYGQLKLMAEKEVLKFNDERPIVLRITIVNGNSVTGQRSVHEKLLGMISAGETPKLFSDEIRQPCSAGNVAEVAVELAERNDLHGIFHWAGSDPVSRLDLGRAVMHRFGLSEDLVEGVQAASLSDGVRRPGNLTMELKPLDGKLKTKPASLAEQMEELQVPAHLYRWIREKGKL